MSDIASNLIFSFVTSLREVLEAALIIGIVFGYLAKLDRKDLNRDVILGVLGAVIASIGLAAVLAFIFQDQEVYDKMLLSDLSIS